MDKPLDMLPNWSAAERGAGLGGGLNGFHRDNLDAERVTMTTKTDAAERQLNTAIRLFFENRDHLSAYTLAIASREITDDLLGKQSDEIFRRELARLGDPTKVRLSYRERLHDLIKPEYHKDAQKLFNRRQNFLKHADRDPDSEMDDLSARELAMVILFSVSNFHLLTKGRLTREMGTFLCWFGAAEPKLVNLSTNDFSNTILQLKQTYSGDLYDAMVFQAAHRSLNESA